MNILTINLALSTFVFWVAAKLYVLPKLKDYEPRTILLPILLLHSMRHLGLMFLADLSRDSTSVYTPGSLRRLVGGRAGDDCNSSSRYTGEKREIVGVAL